MSYGSGGEQTWYAAIPRSTRVPTLFGIFIIAFTIMGFGVWGGTAPISGAIVASGVFVATGQNKMIQHLEGGVIHDIAVREGDVVKPGQLLIQLDETAPRAELRRLVLRHMRLSAMDTRLTTEAREEHELSFPNEVLAMADEPDAATILASQRMIFAARRNNLNSEIAAIKDAISALQERIQGSQVQLAGVRRQLVLLAEEISAKVELLKTGLVRKPELLALQRAEASLEGEAGRLIGEMGDAKERIARAQEQIVGVRNVAIKTVVEQLLEIRGELNDVRERILSAKGVLNRVEIKAPVEGVVVKLRYHTRGGVVEAGKSIMEILPLQDELIIEARVRPQDIDGVKLGQSAMVRLTALSQRVTPMVLGTVVYISADVLPDEKKGQTQAASDIYVLRVKLEPVEFAAIENFTPTPGMPAEVHVKTAERTFFRYLMKPIEDSMSRAFRER